MKARELVVATRVPSFPKENTGNPFTNTGEIYAECKQCLDGPRYCVSGPPPEVKKALDAHRAMYHSTETSVVLLNQPRQ